MRKTWLATLVTVLALCAVSVSTAQSPVEDRKRAAAQQAYARGQEYMRAESWASAVEYFQTAVRLDPLHWMAHYGVGQAQMALKDYPAAVRAYLGCREALERVALLSVEEKGSREVERENEIRELKESLHRLRSGQVKISSALQVELQLEDRLRFLESSRLRGNEHVVEIPAELMLALGSAYFRAGQLPDAEQAYLEAVKTNGKLGAAHNNLAVIYMLTERFPEATKSVARAEKAGFKVSDAFKSDLEKRAKAASAKD